MAYATVLSHHPRAGNLLKAVTWTKNTDHIPSLKILRSYTPELLVYLTIMHGRTFNRPAAYIQEVWKDFTELPILVKA